MWNRFLSASQPRRFVTSNSNRPPRRERPLRRNFSLTRLRGCSRSVGQDLLASSYLFAKFQMDIPNTSSPNQRPKVLHSLSGRLSCTCSSLLQKVSWKGVKRTPCTCISPLAITNSFQLIQFRSWHIYGDRGFVCKGTSNCLVERVDF